MGNLRSVQKALEYLQLDSIITSDAEVVRSADRVILPGVGAFADAMEELQRSGMDETVRAVAAAGTPLLGICLGMQLLLEGSTEGGYHPGLGLIEGQVVRFSDQPGRKVPHMGWNSIRCNPSPLWEGLPEEPYVYFVHSYYACPAQAEHCIATTNYGEEICIAVQKNHVMGTQFHPEKSGEIGLSILRNFGGIL